MLLEAKLGQASVFSLFFFKHTSQILEKRTEKSIKSMNGFPSKTCAFKEERERGRGIQEDGDNDLGEDRLSCWNDEMRN